MKRYFVELTNGNLRYIFGNLDKKRAKNLYETYILNGSRYGYDSVIFGKQKGSKYIVKERTHVSDFLKERQYDKTDCDISIEPTNFIKKQSLEKSIEEWVNYG